jgi:hypothetical protein
MATVPGAWLWTGYVGTWTFVAQYCAYVFIATVGVLQLIAARRRLRGISFFRSKRWGYAFGAVAIVGAFTWFFGFTGLNLTKPTFDTPPQLIWLTLSVVCGTLVTLGISSLINKRMAQPDKEDAAQEEDGIEVLKRKSYWKAIARYFDRGKTR